MSLLNATPPPSGPAGQAPPAIVPGPTALITAHPRGEPIASATGQSRPEPGLHAADAGVVGWSLTGRATSAPPDSHHDDVAPAAGTVTASMIAVIAVEPVTRCRNTARLPVVIAAIVTTPARPSPDSAATAPGP